MAGDLIVDYNRDRLLKAANVPMGFTRDQVDEYLKCVADPVYFAKTYCKIVTLDGGIQRFNPYPYQENILHQFDVERMVCLMQSRQSGKCVSGRTKFRVRNKLTGEIRDVTAKEFHDMCSVRNDVHGRRISRS